MLALGVSVPLGVVFRIKYPPCCCCLSVSSCRKAAKSLGVSQTRCKAQRLFRRAQAATLRLGFDRDVAAVQCAGQGADVLRVQVHGRGVDCLRGQGESRSHER